jgi:flagellar biosynthesis protein
VDKKPAMDTAVALNYDGENAPVISASGTGDVAEEIVRIAAEHGVHLHQDPVLSRMLATLDIGTEIPRELYELIAEIIAFAYYLQGKVPDNWVPPEAPIYEPPIGIGFEE